MVDVREFSQYQECHIKSSHHMDFHTETHQDLYAEFLSLYHNNYPDNLIVLIGNREDIGHFWALTLAQSCTFGPIGRLCVLRGGIDAAKVECPRLLRKS